MTPLAQLPIGAWRDIRGVFTDIDDTLTTAGEVSADAVAALGDLRRAGLHVIAVTGRPAGWSEALARQCLLDAVVAENGAVAWVPSAGSSAADFTQNVDQIATLPANTLAFTLSKIYQQDAATRAAHFARLQQVADCVLREVPGATLARDSGGRETDIAIDHSEFSHLRPEQISQVVAIMRREGLNASVSSIHINGWIGDHDKWQGACWIARELLGINLPAQVERWVYVGDSANDQVMFQHFRHSVGVANIRHVADQLQHLPRYVTQAERGAGFAEMTRHLLLQIRPKSHPSP